jgi:hypothetical protein
MQDGLLKSEQEEAVKRQKEEQIEKLEAETAQLKLAN